MEGWHVKGRDLSQHSFFCVGIENAVSEQEGRGLSGEEGWGEPAGKVSSVMASSASGSQVTTRCYIIQIP